MKPGTLNPTAVMAALAAMGLVACSEDNMRMAGDDPLRDAEDARGYSSAPNEPAAPQPMPPATPVAPVDPGDPNAPPPGAPPPVLPDSPPN